MPRNLFPLLGQLLPCILLILMGWGLGDLSRFFCKPGEGRISRSYADRRHCFVRYVV